MIRLHSRICRQYRRQIAVVVLAGTLFVVSSCATQPAPEAYEPPGFFLGLFHGFTLMFSLIGGLFTHYRVYAFPNSGGWYDFGYAIGAASFFGGSGRKSARKIDRCQNCGAPLPTAG